MISAYLHKNVGFGTFPVPIRLEGPNVSLGFRDNEKRLNKTINYMNINLN